ncbi:DUF6470 family protein [Paenibacillus terreus]|uniref:DUF6470 family protein n=1 Tax=Paenibacillus terreus TaxID=1387834 RepID=A0ABV5B972_9BACL
MNFPRIQIHQGYSKIGLETVKAELSIEQPRAELNMKQQLGEMEIRRTPGSLAIDQSRAWSALGLGASQEMMDRIAQSAKDSGMQAIAEIAQAGDRMMATHKGGDPFAELAYQRFMRDRPINILGEASYDNVDITYTSGTTEIDYRPRDVSFDPRYNMPVIEYTPGSVNAYIAQKNFINFTVTGSNLDTAV